MYAYSRQVAQRFADAGVDVFLQTDLSETGLGDSSGGSGAQFIKPEHLSAVIAVRRRAPARAV